MKKSILVACIAISITSSAMAEGGCKDNIEVSNPDSQYFNRGDGTIIDSANGLMWTTCSIGQSYNNDTVSCEGVSTQFSSWDEALQAADYHSSFASYDDWKLPNIKELNSLVERSCYTPAINSNAFPDTESVAYWSNTPDSKEIMSKVGFEGLIVNFNTGLMFTADNSTAPLIRMVRDVSSK